MCSRRTVGRAWVPENPSVFCQSPGHTLPRGGASRQDSWLRSHGPPRCAWDDPWPCTAVRYVFLTNAEGHTDTEEYGSQGSLCRRPWVAEPERLLPDQTERRASRSPFPGLPKMPSLRDPAGSAFHPPAVSVGTGWRGVTGQFSPPLRPEGVTLSSAALDFPAEPDGRDVGPCVCALIQG